MRDFDARSPKVPSEHQFWERETDELKKKLKGLSDENARLLMQNESLCQDVRTIQAERRRWEAGYSALEAKLAALEKSRAPVTHAEPTASCWGLASLFSQSQADQKPQEQVIMTLQAELSRSKKLAQKLQVINGDLEHKTEYLENQLQLQTASFTEELELIKSRDHLNIPDISDSVASAEKFHEWRVRTTHLILQDESCDRNRPARFAGDMLHSFKQLMPQGDENRVSHKMYQDALEMVHKAAELDTIFRLSKAPFHVFITRIKMPLVEPPKLGFEFDPDTMERVRSVGVEHWRNTIPIVDLAVSPGIFKVVNARGSNGRSDRVLVKLRALCNLQAAFTYLGIDEIKEERNEDRQAKVKDEEDYDVDMLEVV
ncbi:hypothetical protein NEMBOFW57_007173 [Staphylotrichum longicolle]|uniref:Uncharacterized protein n=1 Tax=Staphylotrichum longicolle TaxID=669026 RepID=A0AAD4EV24_9PEZI|nr:hypothetical protein NEMBOFW57_007173 [Staphylotrichum longicolle]